MKEMINRSFLLLVVLIIVQGAISFNNVNCFMITYENDLREFQITDSKDSSLRISQENNDSDFTPPTISKPSDISYLVNTTGHTISWYIADENPGNYSILHNYRFVDTERNKTWSGNQTITISIDNLAIGIHLFSILVEDFWHNSASDDVIVMVAEIAAFPTFTTTNTNPDSLAEIVESYFIIGLISTIVILVSVLIVGSLRYRKRNDLPLKLPPEDPLELELLDDDDFF